MIKKNCLICDNEFMTHPYLIKMGNGKFCSRKCYGIFKKSIIGEKHPNWKGNNVGYHGIHRWVVKQLGTPTKCAHCGKDGLTERQIGWANIDHKYRRNVKDWIRLCRECHERYDFKSKSEKSRKRMLGTKLSTKTREKISKSNIGKKSWNKGNRIRKNIKCAVCGIEFHPKKNTSKFCSRSCSTKSRYLSNLIK